MSALLYRAREKEDALLAEFKQQEKNTLGRLGPTEPLITNNLFGCVNAIYIDVRQPSIFLSGFTSLTLIARENMRHLLSWFIVFSKPMNQAMTVMIFRWSHLNTQKQSRRQAN